MAAYAAKAGIPCIIFTAKGAVGPLVTQMRAYEATVVAAETKADRWPLMRHAVQHYGYFPTSPFFAPVVGSNPYGTEGYKTLAYEVAEQMDWRVPDCCVLPVCSGDALLGMWRGFEEMRAMGWIERLPRMFAGEIHGSLSVALQSGRDELPEMPQAHETVAKSTIATRSTFQALDAIRKSGGTATIVGNDAILEWQGRLASQEGLYAEPAAADAMAAMAQLRKTGEMQQSDSVVAFLTASGLKDPEATAAQHGDVITIPSDSEAAFSHLRTLNILPS